MDKISVFLSYSHEDEAYKNILIKHLISLRRNDVISTWDDRQIIPGQVWDEEIKEKLEAANIILLLVSVDFLNSSYSNDVEIARAIDRHDKGEATVIPIILRQCDWKGSSTLFSKLQALPKDGIPIRSLPDEDDAFYRVAEGIKLAVEALKKKLELARVVEKSAVKSVAQLIISRKSKGDSDTPPNNQYWIGREKELNDIDNDSYRVVFISGMGGQGKSGLASYYAKDVAGRNPHWEFWDWRDCKEKENRIHTKITSAIERLTNGLVQASQLSEESIDDVIDFFFAELEERQIVYVFDNIDGYIDLDKLQLSGHAEKLYNAALNKPHKCKFIFTCRTSIIDVDTKLLTVKLQGLSEQDTLLLFQKYSLSIRAEQTAELARRAFSLTKGHPLWLNLIAAQARQGFESVDKFINRIKGHTDFNEESISSILSDKILKSIWEGLNDNQKSLLRALAETVRAETEQTLSRILDAEMNGNRFFKSMKALKQLNLIVIKSKENESDTFELHPLVREYVIQNFVRKERAKYITLFVNFYDGITSVLKAKIANYQPLSFYENWTVKIELLINSGEYKAALTALQEIADPLYNSGYTGEYIRIAKILFSVLDWESAVSEELNYFHAQINNFIDALAHAGFYDEAERVVARYENTLLSKNSDYINFCNTKAEFYWFRGQCDKAASIAEEALLLDKENGTQNNMLLQRTLGLALRDSGQQENIEKALELFLAGNKLEDMINGPIDRDISGEVYGNLGRCLQLLGKEDDAMKCYTKSVQLLESFMNKGYAYQWIGENLLSVNKVEEAAYFIQKAVDTWKSASPVKAEGAHKKLLSIVEEFPSLEHILGKSEEIISSYCKRYTDKIMMSNA